jgi:hypothetical protein
MKFKYSIIAMAVILLGVTACSDQFLEEKRDYNNLIPVDIYKDKVQAGAVFAVIYKQILGAYNSPLCGADPLMRQGVNTGGQQYFLTEEIPSGYVSSNIVGDGKYNGNNDKTTKAGNHINNPPYWNDPSNGGTNANFNNFTRKTLFPTVYLINDYILAIDRSRSLIDDDDFWDALKGQAIFARAWLYFDAIRLWGGVPYYCTETDTPLPTDRSLRMSIQDCIDKICADFKTASELLPPKWDANNEGRFTSVAALAMISRARLYAASPVFNASWDNTGSTRWQAALDAGLAAETAANAAGYGTSVNNIDSWDKAFYNYDGMTFNPEAIIKVPKSDASGGVGNTWENYIRPGVVRNGTQAGLPAPEQMIGLFPLKNGKRPTVDNGYNDEKFYRNRDPRFYRTFAFSGCEWPGTDIQVWLYAYKYDATTYRYTDGSSGDNGAMKKSRAIVWKMSDPNVATASLTASTTDILEYRYAEILLNVAECYAAKGDAGNCLNYLKKIRQRVGIDAADNYGLGSISDSYALIEAVLYERFVELAYEGKRTWDMKRWLLYEGGAGFDPRLVAIDGNNIYNPEEAYGMGWKLYNGTNGRPTYTKTDNVLTRLGLSRYSGTKHRGKIWGYDLSTAHAVTETNHPLKNHSDLLAVPPIKRDMDEDIRNAAFDKLETFYTNAGLVTIEPANVNIGLKYAMDSGNNAKEQGFLFAWRGWYYIYPIHYDMYTLGKGNVWITQTEGWMTANANPSGTIAEQDGTYVYCLPE